MFPSIVVSLSVAGMVVAALWVRYATQYSPESALRLWVTRLAVAAVLLWLVSGFLPGARTPHSVLVPFAPWRTYIRLIVMILLVWSVFSDEL